LHQEIEVTATGAEVTHVTRGYDSPSVSNGRGRLTSVADDSGTTVFHYDPRGNTSRRTHALVGLAGNYTYEYAYNDRDQLTGRTFPAGGPWSATDQGTETYLYTSDGILTDVYRGATPWAKWSGWNAHRKPTMSYRHWNGFEWAHMTEFEYDPEQRLSAMAVWTADGDMPVDNLYTYDAVGNLEAIATGDSRPWRRASRPTRHRGSATTRSAV
jgi:YD repeat-containing protein